MSNIVDEVKSLGLPFGSYSVVGSGALSVRGIRKHNDIDLVVTEELYRELKGLGWLEEEKFPGVFHLCKGNFEVGKGFSHIDGCKLTVEQVIKNSDSIDGVSFMSLNDLIELKRFMGRTKDVEDIRLVEKYLEMNRSL